MKTLWQVLAASTLLSLTSLYLIGCNGKSGSNSNQQSTPAYVVPSNTTSTTGTSIFTSLSSDYNGLMNINLTFYGDVAQLQYLRSNGFSASPIISYSGVTVVQGQMTVAVGQTGVCGIPAGTYNLMSINQGQWSNAIVSNLMIQANGPASLVLMLSQAQVSAKSQSQNNLLWSELPQQGRLFGNLFVQSVNGSSCQQSILIQ